MEGISLRRQEFSVFAKNLTISKPTSDNSTIIKWSFLSTVAWMCLAHLCRWMNLTMASHDSIMVIQDDAIWEITLGRFLQPLFVLLRGNIASPFLIGIVSTFFLSLIVILSCKLLDFVSPKKIVLFSGVLATCFTITLHNATFIFSIDLSMAACFLGALAVFLTVRFRYGFLPGILCFFSIFALSPGYITFPITLVLIYMFKCALQGFSRYYVISVGIKALVFVAIGTVLYLTIYPMIIDLVGTTASSYKGFSSITDFDSTSFGALLWETYSLPFKVLFMPPTYGRLIVGLVNCLLLILTLLLFVVSCINHKISKGNLLLAIAIMLLIPFGMNCAYIAAREATHELFFFSFNLFYALVLLLFSLAFPKNCALSRCFVSKKEKVRKAISCTIALCFAIVLITNIIYANQVYTRKDLEAQATLSFMTRVADDIESIDGYSPGVTPVAFAGDIRLNGPYFHAMYGFEESQFEVNGLYNGSFAVTHDGTYWRYVYNFLNLPMNILSFPETAKLAKTDAVNDLPIFPHNGYCSLVDGVVVVKLSDIPESYGTTSP